MDYTIEDIDVLLKYGIEKFIKEQNKIIENIEKKKIQGKIKFDKKITLHIRKKSLKHLMQIKKINLTYSVPNLIYIQDYLSELNLTKAEKIEKIDRDINKLKIALSAGKKLQKSKFSYIGYILKRDINFIAQSIRINDVNYNHNNQKIDAVYIKTKFAFDNKNDFKLLIDKKNKLIKERIRNLEYQKHCLKKKKSIIDDNENNNNIKTETKNIKEDNIKNLKIYSRVRFRKKSLQKEQNKFKSIKLHPIYNKFAEKYQQSLLLIEKFISGNQYNSIINEMEKIKTSVAETIFYYLNAKKTKNDVLDAENYDLSLLISSYQKVYKVFKNKLKKFEKNERERIIEEFNKSRDYSFDIENFNTNSMIKYANNKLIKDMVEKKHYYVRDVEHDYMDNILPAPTLIVQRAKYMTLEEVGNIYRIMDEEYKKISYAYEKPYELQQNFIIAIYKLLIQRNLINNKQELTKELEKEICEKYIKRKLILNVEKKEDNKIL